MPWQNHIEQKPDVMLGKPVIKGTRITVELILERLGAGWTEAQLLHSYPHLKADDIRAALTFASRALASDETVFLAE
jgi:uncharacterized protein (DUF433 family)